MRFGLPMTLFQRSFGANHTMFGLPQRSQKSSGWLTGGLALSASRVLTLDALRTNPLAIEPSAQRIRAVQP